MTQDLMVANPDLPTAPPPSPPVAGLPATVGHGGAVATAGDAAGLTQTEKAAIIMIALGPEAAATVLGQMGEQRIRRFAQVVNAMKQVSAEIVEEVIEEFLQILSDQLSLSGGPDEVRKFLGEVLDSDSVTRIMEDLGGSGNSIWTRLAAVDEARLAAWLKMEHAQVAAVVLTKLNSLKSAKILERFDSDFAQVVVLRMSRVPSFDATTLAQISDVIERDFLPTVQREKGARKPADLIAGLMNHVSSNVREDLLGRMEQEAPALTQEVQRVMFTFADIVERVRPRDVGAFTKEVDEPVLMTALKSAAKAGNPSVDFIFSNISKRLSERMREDLEAMPDPSKRDGEAAQNEVVAAIKDLVSRGTIQLVEAEGGEE
ncbi:MAG: FliG C-terminal domain-containing protein [Pseudomonadota bacterium]